MTQYTRKKNLSNAKIVTSLLHKGDTFADMPEYTREKTHLNASIVTSVLAKEQTFADISTRCTKEKNLLSA